MQVRLATKQDINALLQIRPGITLDLLNDRLLKQESNQLEYLVCEVNGQLVSHVVLKWLDGPTQRGYPDIEDLYTHSDQRGKGYGTALIAECEMRAKSRGIKKIGLAVNPQLNCPARKLYEKLGYKHTGGAPYVDGVYDGVEDWCIDMVKDLT